MTIVMVPTLQMDVLWTARQTGSCGGGGGGKRDGRVDEYVWGGELYYNILSSVLVSVKGETKTAVVVQRMIKGLHLICEFP